MRIYKKGLGIFGALVLLLQIFLPGLSTISKAAQPDAANSLYFTNQKEQKVETMTSKIGETFIVNASNDLTGSSQMSISLPEGVTLDQQKTQDLNDNNQVMVMYSSEANNVIVQFPQAEQQKAAVE